MQSRYFLTRIVRFCLPAAAMLLVGGEISFAQDDPFGGGGFGGIGTAMSSSISIRVSQANGVKTTKVVDNGRKFTIIESEEDGITVKFTKHYGPDDSDALQKDYPDLFMHVQSFPEDTQDGKVQLSIDILKEHKSDSLDELKKDHPEAYKVHQKYTKQGGRERMRRRLPRALEDPFGGGADPFAPDAEKAEDDSDVDI